MVSARERLGLTQVECARGAGVSPRWVAEFEALHYGRCTTESRRVAASKIAAFLELLDEDVLPPTLDGRHLETERVAVTVVDNSRLLAAVDAQRARLIEASPDEVLAESEGRKKPQMSALTEREQTSIEMHFGTGIDAREYSLLQIGERIGVTRERARQIILKAIEKLRKAEASASLSEDIKRALARHARQGNTKW